MKQYIGGMTSINEKKNRLLDQKKLITEKITYTQIEVKEYTNNSCF